MENQMVEKIKDFIKFIFAFLLSFLVKIIKKDIWIITERKGECKDNGYYLFKYIMENYPKKNVYYAIERDSSHIEKIQKYGHIIKFNSFLHYIYALSASRLIGAFLPCGIPDSMSFYKFSKIIKGKKIFLQHGITTGMIDSLKYDKTKLDAFVCAAKPESEFAIEKLGYPLNNIAKTGFCRYDGLKDFVNENFILLMPTWRHWIPSATWHENYAENPNEFEYFTTYKNLINNVKLHNLLYSKGYKLVFFIHHELQPYVSYFGSSSDSIILATEQEYDVQDLMKRCSCLITDYSSVAFDVAYMNKPIVYYQFDEEEYYSKHYAKGYYDYHKMGFGPVAYKEEDVIERIREFICDKCRFNKEYTERRNNFFLYNDTNNCERVYNYISNME